MTSIPTLIAAEITTRAAGLREWASRDEERVAEKRAKADLLDQVAAIAATGGIATTEQMKMALEAARPRDDLWLLTKYDEEAELRKAFGIEEPAPS